MHYLLVMKAPVIHPLLGNVKARSARKTTSHLVACPRRPVIYLPNNVVYTYTIPNGHRGAHLAALRHQAGSRPLVAVCSHTCFVSQFWGIHQQAVPWPSPAGPVSDLLYITTAKCAGVSSKCKPTQAPSKQGESF